MALTAIIAMLHDVAISVGIYSVFGFEVTPATVVAFLTVLGYSLYDSIVVFDRIRENERRLAASGLTAGDLVNVSTNQVLLRSILTTISAALPCCRCSSSAPASSARSTLREFAIALLVGMITGAYSSLFVAAPLLGLLKARAPEFAAAKRAGRPHLVGESLRAVVIAGAGAARATPTRRRRGGPGSGPDSDGGPEQEPAPVYQAAPASQLLSHPPRPRKKKRR